MKDDEKQRVVNSAVKRAEAYVMHEANVVGKECGDNVMSLMFMSDIGSKVMQHLVANMLLNSRDDVTEEELQSAVDLAVKACASSINTKKSWLEMKAEIIKEAREQGIAV